MPLTLEELNAALDLQRKINRMKSHLADLRQTGGVGSAGSNTPVTGGDAVFVGQVILEKEQEIAELKALVEIERVVIRRYLDRLELEDVERKLMVLRYVECRPWSEIRISLGYAERQAYRIHKGALNMAVHGSR